MRQMPHATPSRFAPTGRPTCNYSQPEVLKQDVFKFWRTTTLNDGSVESICMKCFLTISRTWGDFKITEKELVEIEATHECDKSRKSKQL